MTTKPRKRVMIRMLVSVRTAATALDARRSVREAIQDYITSYKNEHDVRLLRTEHFANWEDSEASS